MAESDMTRPEIKLPPPRLGTIQERIDQLKAMENIKPVMGYINKIDGTTFVRYDKNGQFAGSIFKDKKGTHVTIGNETCTALDGQEIDICTEHT